MVQPDDTALAVAKGRAPGGGASPYEMTWALSERTGEEPLASQFLLVLEPYEGTRRVQRIERLRLTDRLTAGLQTAVGVRVVTEEFVDTLIFQSGEGAACETEDGLVCDGEFGFWRERGGRVEAAVLAHGQRLQRGDIELTLPKAQYTGQIERCDWSQRTLVIQPAPLGVEQLPGQHLQIHNDGGSHASYLIQAARPVADGCEITLALDPRIGEGFVQACQEGAVVSRYPLRLASLAYYAGKTLANEDGSAVYRLRDVEDRVRCVIDPARHGTVAVADLERQFQDRDGDGLSRYVIYDYGPGDQVTLNRWTVMREP
jgi:hypothetical protein